MVNTPFDVGEFSKNMTNTPNGVLAINQADVRIFSECSISMFVAVQGYEVRAFVVADFIEISH
jgi:hypothetical protein